MATRGNGSLEMTMVPNTISCSRLMVLGFVSAVTLAGGGSRAHAEDLVERKNEPIVFDDGYSYSAPNELVLLYKGGPEETWALGDYGWQPGQRGTHAPLGQLVDGEPFNGFTCLDDPELTSRTPAAEGVETVPARVPTWCKNYRRDRFAKYEPYGEVATPLGGEFPKWPDGLALDGANNPYVALMELQAIGVAACDRLRYGPRQRRVANWLQQWVNTYKVPLREVEELLSLLVVRADFGMKELCKSSQPGASLALCASLSWAAISRQGPPQGYPDKTLADPAVERILALEGRVVPFYLDWREGEGPLTVLERLAFIRRLSAEGSDNDLMASLAAEEFAKVDFDALRSTFDLSTPLERWVIDRSVPLLKSQLMAGLRGVGSDLVLSKKQEYVRLESTDAELLEAVRPVFISAHPLTDFGLAQGAMTVPERLAATREKASRECGKPLDALFEASMKGREISTHAAWSAFLVEPRVELILQGISRCQSSRYRFLVPDSQGPYGRPPWVVGWRTHLTRRWEVAPVGKAQLDAALKPSAADTTCARKGKIDLPCLPLTQMAREQLISKVTKSDSGVLVEWAQNFWMEDIEACVETKQVDKIMPDGSVVYREKCRVVRREKRTEELPPTRFDGPTASLLGVGQVVRFAQGDAASSPVVLALFPDFKTAMSGTSPLVIFDTARSGEAGKR